MNKTLDLRRFGAGATVFAAALGVAAMVVLVTALRGANAQSSETEVTALPVQTLTVSYQSNASIGEAFPGLVTARRESALGFERGGRIDAMLVDVGDRVTAGETLARLDTRALAAQVAAADAQTAEARVQVSLSQATEERQRTLMERGHISQQRLDEAATSTQAADARRAAAAASADALRAQLALSVITAPYDGVVTARLVDEGAIAAPGQAVLNIVEDGALEIRVGLPPATAARLVVGQSYDFDADAGAVTGVFRASTGVVDVRTRSVTVLFDIAEGETAQAGQVARLILDAPIDANGFWVPTSALAEGRRGLWAVYVLEREESGLYRIEPHSVEALRVEADRIFVRGAVREGAMVLESGLQRVTPGQLVRPVDG
tara:strand:+ start:201 stop:1328 length:1128 start_codon:yes stop_codon:yes gene_type:complete